MALPVITATYIAETTIGPARIVNFEIPGGVTTPEEAAQFVSENAALFIPPEHHGIILNGRGPVWVYGMAIGEAHASTWIATADPRLGAVVIRRYREDIERGTQIAIPTQPTK